LRDILDGFYIDLKTRTSQESKIFLILFGAAWQKNGFNEGFDTRDVNK
jgi:hypothetical protein